MPFEKSMLVCGIRNNAFADCPKLKYLELTLVTKDTVENQYSGWGLPSGCVIVCKDGMFTVPQKNSSGS